MAKANKVLNAFNFFLQVNFILRFQVEFRCEHSPKQVMVWVEKDTKAKEVTSSPSSTLN